MDVGDQGDHTGGHHNNYGDKEGEPAGPVSPPSWTSMGCKGATCVTIVFSTAEGESLYQHLNSTVIIQPSPVVVTLPGPILSFFPQNTIVGSTTSAAVGSILSCDGVPITSGCCDLSGISRRYCGSRYPPC
ncbi:hypothetical protein QYF61_022398 [Mycteria americana]|uniref:Keratin n=1 Tax=Mycteria americana TaxID=33587 RepID=A0AAN7RJS6_MYCAM|nr:hypothetical protein QYF61_022398 [Mycteria americana]